MDAAIVAKSLTDKRFQLRKFAGLCWLTPGKLQEGNTPVFIPAKVTTLGEYEFIVPDDNFNIITYHRLLQTSHVLEANDFGDKGSNIDAVLTVIGFTSKLRLTADELEALFIAGFPGGFSKTFISSIQMRSVFAEPVSSNFDSTSIFNTEYRGNTYFLKPETIMFQIRYRLSTVYRPDCFTLCCDDEEETPEAPEPSTEMALVESEFEIPLFFADASSTDMFFFGNESPTGRDVLESPYFGTHLRSGNFKSSYAFGGAFTKVAHPIIGDTDRIGGAGNGWNPISPDCVTLPLPFQGELCKTFTVDGQDLDFPNSHMDLVDLLNYKNIVSANINDGTIEELFWQIDRTIIVTGQTVIPILFGLESATSYTGKYVAIKTCEWIALIEAEYPDQQFIFVFDVAALWSPNGGETTYNIALLADLTVPMSKVAIRVYCHGFKLWENQLTGVPENDIPLINSAMTTTLEDFSDAIAASAFADCKVFVAQYSSNDEAYSENVINGTQMLASVYPRMYKHFIEKARDGVVNYFGASAAGVSRWINANNQKNLDFKFLSVMNRLIESGTNALTITYTGDGIDMYGGKRGDTYCLIVQNRGASDYVLPTTMNLDSDVTEVQVTFSTGEWCQSVTSEDSVTYEPGLTIKARSINYLEIISTP